MGRARAVAAIVAVVLICSASLELHADQFVFNESFTTQALNNNLDSHRTDGFALNLTNGQAVMTQSSGVTSGYVNIFTKFQLEGDFTATLTASRSEGNTSSAGLEAYFNSSQFSDIYFVGTNSIYSNVYPSCCAIASISVPTATFRIERTGNTLIQQYDDGSGFITLRTAEDPAFGDPLLISFFLTQEQGFSNSNTVSFDNLNITADGVLGFVAPVPEPSSISLICISLPLFFFLRRSIGC